MDLEKYSVKIQKVFRGYLFRLKRLPLILYIVQKYLKNTQLNLSFTTQDGRVNSSIDEISIIESLKIKFSNKIKVPPSRMWYDILLFDNLIGWIPVNIKSTTTLSYDNTGNLATCVYAYTDTEFDFEKNENFENGEMSLLLIDKIKKGFLNRKNKKDYYFLVVNKINPNDVIVNSMKGLSMLKSNVNNLPFQVCWNKNREYKYDVITKKVDEFLLTMNKSNKSWKENFLKHIKKIKTHRCFHLFKKRKFSRRQNKKVFFIHNKYVAVKPAINPKRCPV
jgi:hypothetical protein